MFCPFGEKVRKEFALELRSKKCLAALHFLFLR